MAMITSAPLARYASDAIWADQGRVSEWDQKWDMVKNTHQGWWCDAPGVHEGKDMPVIKEGVARRDSDAEDTKEKVYVMMLRLKKEAALGVAYFIPKE